MSFIGKAVRGVTNMFGLTGDVPQQAQSRTGFFPPYVNIYNPLYEAEMKSGGSKIENTGRFTSEGERLKTLFENIRGRKAEELEEFTTGGRDEIIAREQQLFQDAVNPDITRARNQLRNDIIGGTGGLFTTPGGQQALAAFEADLTADTASRNIEAINRAETRQRLLESDELNTLQTLVNYQNLPAAGTELALRHALGAAEGNTQSARILAQNEQANRQASSDFLSMIVGAFSSTSKTPSTATTGRGFTQSPGTSFGSQAFGNALFPSNQFATSSAFSVNTPSFSGFNPTGFNSPGARNALFGGQTFAGLN